MTEAVIVSTARTPIGKAFRGALNITHGADLAAHALRPAIERAKIDPAEIEEVVLGCGNPEGATGGNIARHASFRAGVPSSAAAVTVSRFCASGLEAIAHAAKRIIIDKVPIVAAGGVESISLVQPTINRNHFRNPWLETNKPDVYLTMIETADIVAARYGVTREAQDAFALESQRRTAAAQAAGIFDDEIVPFTGQKAVTNKATGETRIETVTLDKDEGNRPDTTLDGLSKLASVREGQFVTAGNASQLSDGASASVVMSSEEAARRNIAPLGVFRGLAVAGCEPDEMGIGPVLAVPRLLKRQGLNIDDIGLWELNEAFASQAVCCRDRLGIDPERLNVSGGAISIGHPYGMTGARLVGHALLEGRRRGVKYAVVTMCVAGGMGAAALVEIA
jgi:acetyl-CoA C-acetyltransferase